MTRGEAARAAAATLRDAGADTPELDARLLAAVAFGIDRARLLADRTAPVSDMEAARLARLVARRAAGEPIARLLGRREFWGLDFALTPETLVPRPDTETVVQSALAAVRDLTRPLRILDLGVGSGCLLLALLSERGDAFGCGVDMSVGAAAAARENARSLGLDGRAKFIVGDWATALNGPFDLVVSNPPYIVRSDIAGLDREVRDHDPRLALDGGESGLDAYAAILSDAPRLLAPDGAAVVELGVGQVKAVGEIASRVGLRVERVAADLGGVPRAMTLRSSA